jgi:cytochrome c biogenesis protein CcdA
MIEPTFLLAFLAGVLTAASPCILPILPPMLAGSIGHRLRPVFIVLGSTFSFTLMGGVLSAVGLASGGKDSLRFVFAWLIIAFGAGMFDRDIKELYVRYLSRISERMRLGINEEGHPLASAFFLGMSLGIIWLPCIGLILGSILAYTIYQGNLIDGSLFLMVYSLGLGVPMLAIAYTGRRFSSKAAWLQGKSAAMERLAGFILILTGIAILFGIDKFIQTKLLTFFLDYETFLLDKFG